MSSRDGLDRPGPRRALTHAAQIRGVCRELALFDLDPRKVRVESVLATPLSGDEMASLSASAEAVSAVARSLGP